MSIIINDNFSVNVGKPVDSKYLNITTPWTSIIAAESGIPLTYRYLGLTINIAGIEYWWKNSTANGSLIEKKFNTEIPIGDFITGATNIGYFSGNTGIQILPIDNLTNNLYDGNYSSIYNYYYMGIDGLIYVGAPSDGIERRGYVRPPTILDPNYRSWIWNECLSGSSLRGWIFVDGNIQNLIGTSPLIATYYNGTSSFPYTESSWTSGAPVLPVQGWVAINLILGSLTTGNTITIGARPFAITENNDLHFRTIISQTPKFISVRDDETFIYLSGTTSVLTGRNLGTGVGVYKNETGSTMQFKTLLGDGNYTTVTEVGDNIIISSNGASETGGLVTGATNGLQMSNKNVVLGGTLTGDTTINTGLYGLQITGGTTQLIVESNGISFSHSGTSVNLDSCAGLTYSADYSPNYVCRSLPDVEYVNNTISAFSGGVFSSNIIVSIAAGKTFGKYCNGDIVPASGKTANEVIIMALAEALVPTVNLSSSSSNITFGLQTKTVNLTYNYTINSLGATIADASLEWRRGNTGSWVVLSTTTATPTTYNHVIDDSSNRFNTSVINYRYTITDSVGATLTTTLNITPIAYATPSMTLSLGGIIISPETQNIREKGNKNSSPSGTITTNSMLVKITEYSVDRRYDGGGWTTISTVTGLNVNGVTIPPISDSTIPTSATSIDYRISYIDEYTIGTGGAQAISFKYFSYWGFGISTLLDETQIKALTSKNFFTTQNLTWNNINTPSSNYTFYAYPSSYANITSIIKNGVNQDFGAWTQLSQVSVTNVYGESLNYKVWKTNATLAYGVTDSIVIS